ncbi:ubiquitin carboxyl-terminal hydrolase 30-like [Physella acuta]|uniref:ubiquitin carboxyl-terminal hydrolase 30-like n=1 Tax=Physella acuta TaxID=109671 RepID=UPI0027DDE622|nr:ubiquitin carboxyl-terminal hydrolase 30-like [Physella acuta]
MILWKMFSRYIFAIGATVVGAVTTAYIFLGPSKKRPKGRCRGLVNIGNSCFLNSLLQSWAACPSIYNWLRCSLEYDSNLTQCGHLLTSTIFRILQVLNNEVDEASDPYNPSSVFRALRAKRWVISSEEQDMHELFHVLTETLDEEASCYPSVISLFDIFHLQDPRNAYQSDKHARTRSQGLLPVLPNKQMEQPTRGLLASQLQCLSCGARSPVKYDVFDSLTLSFPRNYWGPLSLDSLLHQFVTPEVVQDVECHGCAKISQQKVFRSNFRKRISIGKLPQVLCVHLPRTQWLDNGIPVKRFDHVSFPETLHMDPYLYCNQGDSASRLLGGVDITMQMLSQSAKAVTTPTSAPVNLLRTLNFDQQFTRTGLFVDPQASPEIPREFSDVNHNAPPELYKVGSSDFSYKLAAVVCHIGDSQLGHFVAYRRGIHGGGQPLKGAGDLGSKWWYTSDSSVSRVSQQQVLSSEAYMLFYERI